MQTAVKLLIDRGEYSEMIPCGASTWRARDGIVLLLLAAAGAGLCVTLYFLVVVSENGTADHAFTETFTSQGTAFVSFFKERLLAARALSDAIVSFPTLPTPDVMQMVRVRGKLMQRACEKCNYPLACGFDCCASFFGRM